MRSDGGHCHRSRPTDRCLRRSSRILTRRWRTDPRNRTPRNAIRSREGSAPAGAAADVPLAAAPAGQADGRGGAAALFAVEGEGAAVHLDEGLGYGEAEAGAVVATGEGAVDLAERLERVRNLFRRHADAGVADADQEIAGTAFAHRDDVDVPAGRRELDSVGQ